MMAKSIRTRLYVPQAGLAQLQLTDDDSLSVRRSLRLESDDEIACFNGDGMEYGYRLEESSRKAMILSLQSSQPNPRDDLPPTTLLIAATKGKTKDRMVRDLPPLGATRIIFYSADRSVCQPQSESPTRLQKIAIEACRQCGRSTIPEVTSPDASLADLFESESLDPAQSLLFWERASDEVEWRRMDYRQSAILIFGPEGGFSEEESEWFQRCNMPVASLGRRILRSELAVVVGTALMQSHRHIL